MARKIRFPLKMKNGAEVRTLDQLKENFDLESVLGYFVDGKLSTWLADRYYDEKAEAVSALSADMPELNSKLCEILEIDYQPEDDSANLEYVQRRNEKLKILNSFTDDNEILNNIDLVAMDQDELFDILDEEPKTVYLYGDKFSIPLGKKNVCYIGVNNPIVLIDKSKYVFEYDDEDIKFRNVRFDNNVNPYVTKGELLYIKNKYKEAFPLIKEAAENGNPRAMYIMIRYYSFGYEAVSIDEGDCFDWGEKSFAYKEPLSMYGYACWCLEESSNERKKIYTQIFNEIESLAEREDIIAQVVLGDMYRLGHGVGQDYSKAVEWYKKAAEQGYADAQYNLGVMYRDGNGVRQDYSKAVEWYKKAAEQGVAQAQCNLGSMYYNGNGVRQDYSKAFNWYRIASGQQFADAQRCLAKMYRNGIGVNKDKSRAKALETSATMTDFSRHSRNVSMALMRMEQELSNKGINPSNRRAFDFFK